MAETREESLEYISLKRYARFLDLIKGFTNLIFELLSVIRVTGIYNKHIYLFSHRLSSLP